LKMLLFKPEHIIPIQTGAKTQTRRVWKKARVLVGSIQKAKLEMMKSDYFARLKITLIRQDRLGNMTEEDAKKEGGYTLEEFKVLWAKINGSWNPDQVVWVVDFVVVDQDGAPVFDKKEAPRP
jgi:hypothetical protein